VTKTVAGQLNKSWLFRYSIGGRERQMGLGSLTEDKLAAARERATECRLHWLAGIDPIEARERARRLADAGGITFRRAFETFFASKRKSLSNKKHAAQCNRQWKS
jgi:Arm DNA-binding domain